MQSPHCVCVCVVPLQQWDRFVLLFGLFVRFFSPIVTSAWFNMSDIIWNPKQPHETIADKWCHLPVDHTWLIIPSKQFWTQNIYKYMFFFCFICCKLNKPADRLWNVSLKSSFKGYDCFFFLYRFTRLKSLLWACNTVQESGGFLNPILIMRESSVLDWFSLLTPVGENLISAEGDDFMGHMRLLDQEQGGWPQSHQWDPVWGVGTGRP